MTGSLLALTPDTDTVPGAGASTDTHHHDPALTALTEAFGELDILHQQQHNHRRRGHDTGWRADADRQPFPIGNDTANTAFARAARPDYDQWLAHVAHVGGCTHPIRLSGTTHTVDTTTGEIHSSRTTRDMPDEALYTTCGNRRATVCPSCAETYRADTYHLVHAGLVGGKGVPDTVRGHAALFVTFTAPSFGLVHSRWAKPDLAARVCRPRRHPDVCPHGVDRRCFQRHATTDGSLGRPLCLDCYNHHAQVVWNVMSGELWRRTIDHAKTTLTGWAKRHGTRLRVSYAKVAEMQARGVAHFHALIRLDGVHPDNPDLIIPPCEHATTDLLADAIRDAATTTTFVSPPHPDNQHGWRIGWGDQLDIRPVRLSGHGEITETRVAGYLAKYATKATEAAGHTSMRITPDTIHLYTTRDNHVSRLIRACWHLGRKGSDLDPDQASRNSGRLSYRRLRRWAHMLGFGGHFSTKSRRYSTTLKALRDARTTWRRQHHRTADHTEPETTLIINNYTYADTGWHTTGDELLATTAAAKAREHRHTARDELEQLDAHSPL